MNPRIKNSISRQEFYRKPYIGPAEEDYADFMKRVPYKAVTSQFANGYPESEDQQPYNAEYPELEDYQDLENTWYPTNQRPFIMGPNGIPNAGAEDYTPEVFRCVANCCCCSGNLIGPVEITCTYPIVEGPWVKNPDGTTCTTGSATGDTEANICVNPCGNGNCPPDIRVRIKSPTQSPRGKKLWPGQIKEVQVTMLESCSKIGSPACPPTSSCCTGVSMSGTSQMSVGESQTFTIINPVAGCSYEFRKSSGGGKLVGSTYTAPNTNVGCTQNATINLYDKTRCVSCASITIAINGVTNTDTAYVISSGDCATGGTCATNCPGSTWSGGCPTYGGPLIYCTQFGNQYKCDGTYKAHCASSQQTTWDGCNTGGSGCVNAGVYNGITAACSGGTDTRTTEMKANGCCPAQLI
jgi:hypothetical protein